MTNLYLVRHPAPNVPDGVCYGHTDVELLESPAVAAARLSPHLPAEALLVSSPLHRAFSLAAALGTPHTESRFRETDFGEWEMRPYATIERSLIDAWAAHPLSFRPPRGETASEMAARALSAFQDWLKDAPENLIIVAHGGPLRAITGYLLGLPQERWFSLDFAWGHATKFQLIEGWGAQLKWFNRAG